MARPLRRRRGVLGAVCLEQKSPKDHVSLFYETKSLLSMRIDRLERELSPLDSPMARVNHYLTNVQVAVATAEDGAELTARAHLLFVEHRREEQRWFAGRSSWRLRPARRRLPHRGEARRPAERGPGAGPPALRGAVLRWTSHTLLRGDAVHRAAYVDPAVFALEQERIFRRAWLYVGARKRSAAAGGFRPAAPGARRGAAGAHARTAACRCCTTAARTAARASSPSRRATRGSCAAPTTPGPTPWMAA